MSSDGKSLFEGYFNEGKKHGPFRLIEIEVKDLVCTITEGIYNMGTIENFA